MSTSVRDKLKAEVLAAGFQELVPHFARGALLIVAASCDLLDAAEAVARDDKPSVERLLARGELRKASDDDARRFVADKELRFQLLIVQPWVLAQPLA